MESTKRMPAAFASALTVLAALLGWCGLVHAQEVASRPALPVPLPIATTQPTTAIIELTTMAATEPATAPTTMATTDPTTGPTTGPTTMVTTEPTTGPTTMATSQPTTSRFSTTRWAASGPSVTDCPLSFNFQDVPIKTVLMYLSETAGMIVVDEAKVEGRVTLLSRQQIDVSEAVSLLDTVLRQKGYAAIRMGRILKIMTIDDAKKDLNPVRSGGDPEKIEPNDSLVTQIIPIKYADAVKLKADITPLIPSSVDIASNASSNTLIVTGTQAVVRRIVEIVKAIDVQMSESSTVKVWQLKYANATNAARLISEIFKEDPQGGQSSQSLFGGGGGGRGGRGGGGGFMLPGLLGGGGANDNSAGKRSVKVNASADDRTNTLVISAAPDVMKVIDGVVQELDKNPVDLQGVFIFRLKNSTAANLEGVLNNIFGTSSGGSSSYGRTSGAYGASTNSRLGGSSMFGGGSGSGSGSRGGSSGSRGGSSRGGSMGGLGSGSSMGNRGTGGTGNRNTGNTGFGGGSYGGSTRGMSAASSAAASELSGQVFVVAEQSTNSLVVTAAVKNFDRVRAIIEDLDRAVPQVLIKVLIAEVTHDGSLDLGMEFSGFNLSSDGNGFKIGTDFNIAARKTGFTFKLAEENVSAAIRAIATVGKLDVLSRPYILTSDNQEATIMVGQVVPQITSSQTTSEGNTINSIQYQDIGIILDVTPHINPQGLVTLDAYTEISTFTGETVQVSETVSQPVYAKRSAQNRVAIRDGQTIVIGGLMQDSNTKTVDKVPFLGDIPGLGLLFQHTVDKKSKTELLMFLTPHVALQPDELEGMSEQEKAGTKALPGAVEQGAFQGHLDGMKRGVSTRPALPQVTIPGQHEATVINTSEDKSRQAKGNDDGDGDASDQPSPAGQSDPAGGHMDGSNHPVAGPSGDSE